MSTEEPVYWGLNARSYCTLIHVSQLSSFVIPGLGIVLPFVLWIAHKDHNDDINQHGRVTVNWLLSLLVYSIICFILTFVLIGALGFIVLGLLNIIFAIVAAVKANKGELWAYPLSFQFIKR